MKTKQEHMVFALTCLMITLCTALPVMAQGNSTEVEWTDINSALSQAQTADKKILVDFYTDWCGWCKVMDRKTYSDSSVIAYMNEHFLAVKFNPEKGDSVIYDGESYSARQFAASMRVRGYPATGFINENNEVITLLPGFVEADEFLTVLQFIGDDHYLNTSFEDYVEGNKETHDATHDEGVDGNGSTSSQDSTAKE